MSEIEVGDKVTSDREMDSTVYTVLAVHTFSGDAGERAWLAYANGTSRGSLPVDSLKKVEPKFEVGKTYRRIVDQYSNTAVGTLVTVVSVSDTTAVGWRVVSAAPWSGSHAARHRWEEVGVTVNADSHSKLRKLGVVFPYDDAPPVIPDECRRHR